jgi:hypothetical protein
MLDRLAESKSISSVSLQSSLLVRHGTKIQLPVSFCTKIETIALQVFSAALLVTCFLSLEPFSATSNKMTGTNAKKVENFLPM